VWRRKFAKSMKEKKTSLWTTTMEKVQARVAVPKLILPAVNTILLTR